MTTAQIQLAPKMVQLFQGEARYRCAYGGRSGSKTRAFALMTAVYGYKFASEGRTGQILCCREFMNSLSDSSFEEVKSAIQSVPWLEDFYEIGDRYIRSKDKKVYYTFAGLRHNLDSIKSRARILLAWLDEAANVTDEAFTKLLPTVREEGSELFISWNPENKNAPVEKRFRHNTPSNCKIVKINYNDNPWHPDVLDQERLNDKENRPELYGHIWLGDYLEFPEGAFWLREINKCYTEGRIGKLPVLESQPCMTFWDIGNSDGTAIWVVQKVGMEFRCIHFYESWGEPYNHAVKWLKSLDLIFEDMYLPHDADHTRQGQNSNKSPKQMLKELMPSAKWHIVPRIPEITWGIQQTSDMFPYIYIDDVSCSAGLDHLKSYRRKWSNSEQRWSHIPDKSEGHSEAADALRQMAQAFTSGDLGRHGNKSRKPLRRNIKGVV